ncbi:MAG TPA: acetamidase/formamidase family protein [Thermoleophilaceae bacterium]
MATHHLDDEHCHAFWDNTLPPRVRIQPGDTVVFETLEASAKQMVPGAPSEALATLSFDPIHPLTGPVYVEGAEPGDALVVEVVSLAHKGWGWNAVIPGFGLLADDFSAPYLHHYELGDDCRFRDDIRIPYEPFCGVMGVGPRENGRFTTIPPRENGGNMDIRDLVAGSRLLLPVHVPGAMLSIGDLHFAQGDGEVCIAAIETGGTATVRVGVRRDGWRPSLPAWESPARPGRDYFATTGIPLADDGSQGDLDLNLATRRALIEMLGYLVSARGLGREAAYVLMSVAVELRISEIVDVPNALVSALLPLDVFE